MQAKEFIDEAQPINFRSESFFHETYKPIKDMLSDTTIPFSWIQKYPFQYQCLLEQIADYLVEGQIWWKETDHGVVFFDKTTRNIDTKQRLRHFRSTSITKEAERIFHCWQDCLQQPSLIPAHKIRITDHESNNSIIFVRTLQHFKSDTNITPVLIHETTSFQVESIPSNQAANEMSTEADISISKVFAYISAIHESNNRLCMSLTENEQSSSQKFNIISTAVSQPIHPQEKQENNGTILTSTPIQRKNTQSLSLTYPNNRYQQPQTNILSMTIKKPPVKSKSTNESLSKSTLMLVQLFGKTDFVLEYDKPRKALKADKKNKELGDNYIKIISVIKVKMILKEEVLRKQMKKIELSCMKENQPLNVHPTDVTDEYNQILRKLKYVKYVTTELMIK